LRGTGGPASHPASLNEFLRHHNRKTAPREHLLDAPLLCRLGTSPERWGREVLINGNISIATHRRPMAVGFLFPLPWPGDSTEPYEYNIAKYSLRLPAAGISK
jgi:hypothetical protein